MPHYHLERILLGIFTLETQPIWRDGERTKIMMKLEKMKEKGKIESPTSEKVVLIGFKASGGLEVSSGRSS